MGSAFAHLRQNGRELQRFVHEAGCQQERTNVDLLRSGNSLEEMVQIENADYIVYTVLINRQTGVG